MPLLTPTAQQLKETPELSQNSAQFLFFRSGLKKKVRKNRNVRKQKKELAIMQLNLYENAATLYDHQNVLRQLLHLSLYCLQTDENRLPYFSEDHEAAIVYLGSKLRGMESKNLLMMKWALARLPLEAQPLIRSIWRIRK